MMGESFCPRFTVVIPTRDRPAQLRATLEALSALHPPQGGYEILVVDDGSRMPLDWVLLSPRTRLLRCEGRGPAAARNAGAGAAAGQWLAFTDDDCRPDPQWLLRFAEALERDPDAMVGGATVNGVRGNACSAASQDVVSFLYKVENADARDPRFFASCNIAVGRRNFHAIGGFDETFPLAAGEDRAFCDTWRAAGRKLVFVPDAVVHHHHVLDLRRFCRQHFHYGRGAYRLRRHRAGTPGGVKLERLGFYCRLLLYPLIDTTDGARLRRCLLLTLAQFATMAGFVAEWYACRARSRSTAPQFPSLAGRGPVPAPTSGPEDA